MIRLSSRLPRRSTHERVESSTEPVIVEPPSQRQRDVSVRTSQAGGQGNRSTLSIGEFVDERIEIATALIIKARFQLGNKR